MFTQYPPKPSGGGFGSLDSTTPISGNPPALNTLGSMALATQANSGSIAVLATQVSALGTQVSSLSTTVSSLPPIADIMRKSDYDADGNLIVDTADVVDGGVV